MQQVIHKQNQYFTSIKRVLSGEVSPLDFKEDGLETSISVTSDSVNFQPSFTDSILRKEVEQEDKYNVLDKAVAKTDVKLFTPLRGQISEGYNAQEKHYAVDIIAKENSPVKSTADGTVIFAEWTADTGYVMIIET